LQGEIARTVTDEIQVKLTPEERIRLTSNRLVDPDVQDNYLRGLYFAGRFTEHDSQKAITQFTTAIEKDPTFAPAYAELAMVYFWLGNPGQDGPSAKETMPKAKAAVTKALQLDPSLARAHLARGLIVLNSEWNWAEAENQYQIALKLNPNCGWCRDQYSVLLTGLGRNDEAITQIKYAIELDPFNIFHRYWLAIIALSSRQYDSALKQFEILRPNCPVDDAIGSAYAQKKMYPEAIAYLKKALAQAPRGSNQILAALAQVYGLAGKRHETQKIIHALREKSRG
jgi:tetratricopeptide (TPR) repeat protein